MKRLTFAVLILAVVGFFVEPLAIGADFIVSATFVDGGTGTQSLQVDAGTTNLSGQLPGNHQYAVSCSAAATYRVCATSTCTAVSTDSPVRPDGLPQDLVITTDASGVLVRYISFYSSGGATATCAVYDVIPQVIKF